MSEPANDTSQQVTFGPVSLRAAIGTYVTMGIVASMFGPLLATIAQTFRVSLTTASLTLILFNSGGFVGVLLTWWIMRHHGGRRVVRLGLSLLAGGATAATLARSWSMWEIAVVFMGLGFGMLNLGLNSSMTRTGHEGRGTRLSIGNATYGLGAVLGPLLVVGVGSAHFHFIYGALVPLSALLLCFYSDLIASPSSTQHAHTSHHSPHRRAILITFVVGFTFYLAFESTITGWTASVLHRDGYSTAIGGLVTAGFWAGFALGRALGAFAHRFFSARRIVLSGVTAGLVVSPLAIAHSWAPYVFVVLGLLLSASFPMGLMWFSELSAYDTEGLSIIITLMGVGGIFGPGLVSRLVAAHGVGIVPVTIAVYGAIALVVLGSARRFPPSAHK